MKNTLKSIFIGIVCFLLTFFIFLNWPVKFSLYFIFALSLNIGCGAGLVAFILFSRLFKKGQGTLKQYFFGLLEAALLSNTLAASLFEFSTFGFDVVNVFYPFIISTVFLFRVIGLFTGSVYIHKNEKL